MRNDTFLLLNAAIQVKTTDATLRNDSAVRLNDYKQALKKWLTKQSLVTSIVFAENTGYPLDDLKRIVKDNNPYNKEVEFISFVAPQEQLFDKGYAELHIIKYALENSEIAKRCEYFIQASGRIFVPNIDLFVVSLPESFDVVSQFINNMANMDCNLIVQRKSFFLNKVFPYLKENIGKGKNMYYERVFAKLVHLAISEDYRWYPFGIEPIIDGASGTKNTRFHQNWWYALRGTFLSRMFHSFYRTSHGKNRKHLLELWDINPKK